MNRSSFLRHGRSPALEGFIAATLVLIVSGICIAWLYRSSYQAAIDGLRSDLMQIAAAAASQVNGDLHRQMISPDQVGSPVHQELIRPLVRFHKAIPNIFYLYTAILKDDAVHLVLDTATQQKELGFDRHLDPSLIMEHYQPPDREMILALKSGTPQATLLPVEDEFGTFLSGYAPIRDSQGQLVGIVGVNMSVDDFFARMSDTFQAALSSMGGALLLSSIVGILTWRLRRREIKSQEKLAGILSTSVDAILTLQSLRTSSGRISDYRVLQFNPAAKKLADPIITAAAPEHLSLLLLFPGFRNHSILEELAAVAAEGRPTDREFLDSSTQPPRWLRVMAVRLEDGLAMTLSDITWRKREEDEMRLARDSARAADRAKSEFLAMMSHEIRTPMNGIIGFTNLLEDTPLNDEQKDFVETISGSANALLVLINDILDFSKIESGQMELETKELDLAKCLKESLALVAPSAQEKNLRLRCDLSDRLPPMIQGDPTRLRQILLNLLGNAVKFTAQGEIVLRVSPHADASGSPQLLFAVSDTGIGIPADKMDRLFLPFSQADSSTTRQYGGTGLGLAICKRLVELMQGRINVTSMVSVGSTFSFTLPLHVSISPVAADKLPPEDVPAASPVAKEWPPLRVLMAEDNSVNERVLRLLLKKFGYQADLARDGHEAVQACLDKEYDLVIMDVQMPGLDGYQAARQIRDRLLRNPPYIIALTANAMPEDREKALGAGMNDYLTKPVQVKNFEQALLRFLEYRSRST